MNRKLVLTALIFGLFSSAVPPLAAIQIKIPEQYEGELEALEAKRQAEISEALEGGNAGTSRAETRVRGESAGKAPAGDAEATETTGHFLLESVDEATETAETFTGSLPEGQGLVSGQVLDKDTEAPVASVAILLEGTDIGTITDATGRYSLGPAPAGTYTLSFIKSGYLEANVTGYEVVADEVGVFPFALPPRPAEMSDEVYELQDFTVTAQEANDLMMKLELRQQSATQLEVMSAEDFSRYAASDIAEAVKSITGVSLSDGKYAVVRGLNDRYSVTQLNGATLPSPDPDRPAVPLDIFPTGIFQSIETRKTHSPDMPGEASGGLIDLRLLSFPEERLLKFSLSGGINSESQKEWLTTDQAVDRDWIADGADSRDFEDKPANPFGPVPIAQLSNPQVRADLNAARAALVERYQPRSETPDPDFGAAFLYGETFTRENGHKVGVLFAANQSVKHRYESQSINETGASSDSGAEGSLGVSAYSVNLFDATREIGTKEGQVSAVGGIGYEFAEGKRLQYNYLFTRNGLDEVIRQSLGRQWSPNGQLLPGQVPYDSVGGDPALAGNSPGFFASSYTQRTMQTHQLDGAVDFEDEGAHLKVDFSYLYGDNEQIEPDTFDSRGPRAPYRFRRETTQDSRILAVNFTTPLDEYLPFFDFGGGTDFKFGYYSEESERAFEQRQQEFNGGNIIGGGQITFPNNFLDSVSAPVLIDGVPFTPPPGLTGQADGLRSIDGGYFLFDTSPAEPLQIVAGLRRETTQISYNGFGSAPQGGEFRPSLAEPSPIDQDDLIPSINVNIDATENLKLRFAYSKTVARPTYRELQPFPILNLATNEIEVGNPGKMQQGFPPGGVNPVIEDQFAQYRGLEIAKVENYDARAEWYPFSGSLYAVGVFHKKVGNPIERVEAFGQTSTLPVYTFVNNENEADVFGVELELQQNLGDLFGSDWEPISIGGNFTYIDATVDRTELETRKAETEGIVIADVSESRRLYDQPDYIGNFFVNLNLPSTGSDLTLSLNHTGKRLVGALGAEGPDIYEDAFTTVNMVLTQQIPWVEGLSVKLSAKNLNNPTYRRITEQGDNTVPLYGEDGAPASSIDLESYKKGVTYGISVAYTF